MKKNRNYAIQGYSRREKRNFGACKKTQVPRCFGNGAFSCVQYAHSLRCWIPGEHHGELGIINNFYQGRLLTAEEFSRAKETILRKYEVKNEN